MTLLLFAAVLPLRRAGSGDGDLADAASVSDTRIMP
jgi:hypothetical protein